MGFAQEFREFAVKGNAVDMAVGIILGAAFNKIVTSLVNDVIMPPLGMATAGADIPDLAITLRDAVGDTPAVMVRYGAFLNTLIEFGIIAVSVFVVVKMMNRVLRQREAAAA
jgi:large conductance mechanosensitive channel